MLRSTWVSLQTAHQAVSTRCAARRTHKERPCTLSLQHENGCSQGLFVTRCLESSLSAWDCLLPRRRTLHRIRLAFRSASAIARRPCDVRQRLPHGRCARRRAGKAVSISAASMRVVRLDRARALTMAAGAGDSAPNRHQACGIHRGRSVRATSMVSTAAMPRHSNAAGAAARARPQPPVRW